MMALKYKKFILLFIYIILISSYVTSASVICQVSEDNITWKNAVSTRHGGCVDETYGMVYIQNLDGFENYYIRCNNGTTWTYTQVVTDDGGAEKKMILAVLILLPLLMGFLLLFAGVNLSEDHSVLKIFLFLLSMVLFWVSMHFGAITVVEYYNFPAMQNLIGSTTYYTGMTFFVIVSYFAIYSFIKLVNTAAQKRREKLVY
jgi:hypothetical protein